MGQQSVLHAVKTRSQPISKRSLNIPTNSSIAEEPNDEHDASRPLAQTLTALQFSDSATDRNAEKGMHFRNHFNLTHFFSYFI